MGLNPAFPNTPPGPVTSSTQFASNDGSSFALNFEILRQRQKSHYRRLWLLCGVLVSIPLCLVWAFHSTESVVPAWSWLLALAAFLIASLLFRNETNFLQDLSDAIDSGHGAGLEVSDSSLFVSVATMRCRNLKGMVHQGLSGVRWNWEDIAELNTQQMFTPNRGHSRLLLIKTRKSPEPFLMDFEAIAAPQEVILKALATHSKRSF